MPAAPSTDRQLSPQGNMVSLWGPGHSESTWRAGEQELGRRQRAVLTCSVRKGPEVSGPNPRVITSSKDFALKAHWQWKVTVTMRP